MSTSTIEPGTRLAGRYRLESRVSESDGSTLWKAIDEILARAVAIRTFSSDFPRVSKVVTAARTASRLTDPRLTQVFDADDNRESAYVVSEWVAGETLQHMVGTRGPLEPGRAATLLHEAAEAVATAHAAGLAHLRLSPTDLLWTTGGTVKLLGMGVEAALSGIACDDPALADTQGLGRMLYTALTAHTVADDGSGLPTAPVVDGRPRPPRQLQPRVPQALDAIVCRALGIGPAGAEQPLTTPAALAEALAKVPRTPLPLFAGLTTNPAPVPPSRSATEVIPNAATQPAPPSPPRIPPQPAGTRRPPAMRPGNVPTAHAPRPVTRSPATRSPVNRPLIAMAAAVAAVVVGVGGWLIGDMSGGPKPATPSPTATAAPPAAKLQISTSQGFDPTVPEHPDGTAQTTGRLAVDGSLTTDWHTQTYKSVEFGNLKKGLGVLLDMGRTVKVSEVKATLPGGTGATLELRVGSAPDLAALQRVAWDSNTSLTADLKPTTPAQGRYVLLWFTKLPFTCKAKVSNVDVLGWTG